MMKSLIWWNRLAFFLLFLGAIILAFALTFQPKVSDDWHVLWEYQKSAGAFDWIVTQYSRITGRVWIILLATFVLPNPSVEILYRSFIVVEIALLGALSWYCALGRGAWHKTRDNLQAMAIFGTLLWFALPERNETTAWMIGNFAYFVPALFGLAFIAWLERSAAGEHNDSQVERSRSSDILSFLLGFCAGVSHEQVVAASAAYLALVILPFSRTFLLERRNTGPSVWIGAIGLVMGAALLVSAPGNYARIAYVATPTLFDVVERMALYVASAYFDIGTGATGKYVWLGALVFTLLYFDRSADRRQIVAAFKRGAFWLIISVVTLLAMAPVTNFISTRTTFFAIIFLYIGFAAMTFRSKSIASNPLEGVATTDISVQTKPHPVLSTAVLTILGCLVVVEGVVTLVSNASVAAEFSNREAIVNKAMLSTTGSEKSPIRVPFISTQTGALTYIQNPHHDASFLGYWGNAIGRTIEHDVSAGAPLPLSFKPMKAIKFRQKD